MLLHIGDHYLKISNPEKNNRAKQLLKEGNTFEEVRDKIGKEFNESISPSTLSQLNKDVKEESKSNQIGISSDLKNALKNIFDLFDKATKLDSFMNLVSDSHMNSIEYIEKVINQ